MILYFFSEQIQLSFMNFHLDKTVEEMYLNNMSESDYYLS